MSRRICVVTGSRADYGHLRSIMSAIKNDPALTLQIIACGPHLEARFGNTTREIESDGFTLDATVKLNLGDDTNLTIATATGEAVSGIARELARLAPDIVLVLGDRYEILAAGIAATILHIPLAHIHGGEVTEGAFDDAMRHALSKMAALHFVAAEPYRQRLIHMGEDPAHITVSGAPGLDLIESLTAMSPQDMTDLGIDTSGPLFLITYHPVTLHTDDGTTALDSLLRVLSAYAEASMVFTGVNSDPGHAALSDRIAAFVRAEPHKRIAVTSLGQRRYLSLMKAAGAVIGNSSSGLIEAPALHVPTINIGDRQKGRLRSASVLDCGEDEKSIRAAIDRVLHPAFRASLAQQNPAYGSGNAAQRIVDVLKGVSLTQLSTKPFHDIIPPL